MSLPRRARCDALLRIATTHPLRPLQRERIPGETEYETEYETEPSGF